VVTTPGNMVDTHFNNYRSKEREHFTALKLELFAVLFSTEIVFLAKKSKQMSL
jgi:hypothetical protein